MQILFFDFLHIALNAIEANFASSIRLFFKSNFLLQEHEPHGPRQLQT